MDRDSVRMLLVRFGPMLDRLLEENIVNLNGYDRCSIVEDVTQKLEEDLIEL